MSLKQIESPFTKATFGKASKDKIPNPNPAKFVPKGFKGAPQFNAAVMQMPGYAKDIGAKEMKSLNSTVSIKVGAPEFSWPNASWTN
eukprot:NODE_8382_length_412_cov_104.630854_g7509_i0.p2 GENE.NODE_8382_length_412_cov_104.630854_g7509_i0~~NODE_8382_length_412_cov_104.630854_g7509_i0.p2  ORF type:complete len:87 (+),score=16.96 NODE_8382_length_412_cov_104.630854_g7509_i0:63-323(+)